ncbi:amidohydrolase 3 [Pyricularia oryzae 70-15]|uniref:Amidohydrolase 3 n=3 Tax=Pyricularia oryzae TaxID=318829 RepID=G4MMH9_PYRO7|nr:amidohydrolase 3 [Pyricularia oryzae 70-15]EHA56957.1 amidohydrolase 3 [Pyricularia oryzae 70-15]ELQ43689.1 amidohydrolase 3 [Pyricularia oryzae Y34]
MAATRRSLRLMLLATMAGLGQTKPLSSITDEVLHGGKIHTLDETDPTVSAHTIKDGIIVHAGSDDDITKRIGANTTVIEPGGRAVIPSFVDAHIHVLTGAELLLKCNLNYQPLDMAGVLAHVRGCLDADGADRNDENNWLEVPNMDTASALAIGVVPKRELNALNTVRPIMIRGADFYVIVDNSRALQASNIDEITPDPASSNTPRAPTSSRVSCSTASGSNSRAGLSRRRTTVPRPSARPSSSCARTASPLSRRRWRASLWRPCTPRPKPRARPHVPSQHGRHNRPYRAPPADDPSVHVWVPAPESHTEPFWIPAVLDLTVQTLVAGGIDGQMHVDGDLGVWIALNAVEKVRATNPDADYRIGLAHAEIVNPLDWPRFSRKGVNAIVSFQWAQSGPNYIPSMMRSLGPENYGGHMQPFQKVTENGWLMTFGSDWPVDPMNHFLALNVAITRSSDPENPNWPASRGNKFNGTLPGRPLSRTDAMRSITNAGARFLRAEAQIGSLESGKLADLPLLACDYFSVPEEEARRNSVLLTMVGGEVLYVAEGASFGEGVVANFPNDDSENRRLGREENRRRVRRQASRRLGEGGSSEVVEAEWV